MKRFFKRSAIAFALCMAGLFVLGLVKGFSIYHGYTAPGLEAGFVCMLLGAVPALVLSLVAGLLMALLKR